MDVLHNNQNQQPAQHPAQPAQAAHHHIATAAEKRRMSSKFMRIMTVIVVGCASLILILLALNMALGSTVDNESRYIDKKKFQAVFLNGGQVYFGKVRSLNTKFITIDNIYYLRVNGQQTTGSQSSNANQDVSLAKLGCELHGPTDSMVINKDQVLFWENLKDDGQVAKAITTYVKANPQGQKCDTATSTGTTTTPTTDSTKK